MLRVVTDSVEPGVQLKETESGRSSLGVGGDWRTRLD
jgi:hypothetical protein